MFKQLHIDIVETSHNDALWHLRLPENIQQELSSKRSRYEVTLDRQLAAYRPGTHMLDLDSFLMQYLLDKAKKPTTLWGLRCLTVRFDQRPGHFYWLITLAK